MTKSELRQVIREVLKEELAKKLTLRESPAVTDQTRRLKKVIQLQVANAGSTNIANLISKYDFVISDTIQPGTVEVNGSTLVIHSDFLNKNMYRNLASAIVQKLKPGGSSSKRKIVYVLTTFRGKELIYDDFYEAVIDAEGDLVMEANMIDTMYQAPDGTLTEVPETDPNYHRWTEEEGIRT